MADTRRLARLIEITDLSMSLCWRGSRRSLAISAGGLSRELVDNVPTAELTPLYRAEHEWERQPWGLLRR